MKSMRLKERRKALIEKLAYHHENGMSDNNPADREKLDAWQEELNQIDWLIYSPNREKDGEEE